MLKIAPIEINGKNYYPELGTIDGTMLGIEDHGIMSFFLYIDYLNGGTQGSGGYALDGYNKEHEKNKKLYSRTGVAGSILLIRRILETVGVSNWEDLKGKKVFALREGDTFNALSRGLMSANDPDKYFLFEDCFTDD